MAAPLGNVFFKRLAFSCNFHLRSISSVESQSKGTGLADRLRHVPESENIGRPLCRTAQSNPANHTKQHEGLFYDVDGENAQKFFQKGQRQHLPKLFKSFNETNIMVRQPALEVINCLKMANYNFPTIRYILYGPTGAGKSVSLAHITHYCASNDWLIVYIPWAGRFTRSTKEVALSSSRPGRVDLPVHCLDWLKDFTKKNDTFLSKYNPTIEGNYTWTKRDNSETGTPWQQMIDFAIERPKYSTDVMNVLLKEIKLQASQKKFKVLLAIDGVNCFWHQTMHRREEDRRFFYHASEISVVHNLKKMLTNDWNHGAVVCTVDKHATMDPEQMASDLPLYLLKKEGFEAFDPFIPINVDNYSDKEIYSALEYFSDRKWIQNPSGLTDEGKKELIFLSDHNPLELYRVTTSW